MARRDLEKGKYVEPMPNEFYCWGDIQDVGLISKKDQTEKQIQDAFGSIKIEEDSSTPETDYVLKVLGKDSGARIVIPFDAVVRDAYFDKETKEIVLIVATAQGDKEIRVNVKDLVDTYTGDGVTIEVKDNVISITKAVMDKFDDLRKSIDYEKQYRKDGDDKLKAALDEEISNRQTEDAILTQKISDVSDGLTEEISAREEADTKLDNDIKAEVSAREASDANLLQLINNVETNLESAVENLAANDASLEAQIKAEKEAREAADADLEKAIKEESVNREIEDAKLEGAINTEAEEREAADADLEKAINEETKAREDAIAKEISDRKDADTDLAKDYNDKIDKVQDNLQELTRAHIDSVTELQKADAKLHDEITGVYKECISEPIPLDKIRALFA